MHAYASASLCVCVCLPRDVGNARLAQDGEVAGGPQIHASSATALGSEGAHGLHLANAASVGGGQTKAGLLAHGRAAGEAMHGADEASLWSASRCLQVQVRMQKEKVWRRRGSACSELRACARFACAMCVYMHAS